MSSVSKLKHTFLNVTNKVLLIIKFKYHEKFINR